MEIDNPRIRFLTDQLEHWLHYQVAEAEFSYGELLIVLGMAVTSVAYGALMENEEGLSSGEV